MSATLKQSHLYLFSPPAPKSTKGTLLIFSPNPSAPDSLNPLRPKSQLTRSPGRGRPRIDSGPPGSSRRPHRGPGWRRVQKVTGGDRGRQGRAAPYRAAPRRRRKLFPARKLPGSAAADGLPSRLRERGGAPSPGGGQAGRRGLGEASDGQIGAGGAQAPALWGARGRSPAALSPRPRTQPRRRRRHKRARLGVAVPNLPPPFAAAAHRVLCVSLGALGSLRSSPDSWWARHAGSRVFPGAASGARPGQRRRTEEERWQMLSWSGRRRGEYGTALGAAGDQPGFRSTPSRPLPRRDPPVLPPTAASPAPVRRPAPCSAAERARSRILGNPPRPLAPSPSNDLGLQGVVPSNQVSESPASPRECSQWNTTPATHPPWSTRNEPLWALRWDPDPGAQSKSSPAGAVSESESCRGRSGS